MNLKQIKILLYAVAVAAVAAALLTALLVEDRSVVFLVAAALMAVYAVLSMRLWRCPSCGKFLGPLYNRCCPNCGKRLDDSL